MTESLFSSSWYRVTDLTPRLRSHAKIHRHQYRGQTWFVLQDFSTEKFHRFSPAAYYIIGLMNGQRTVQELWDLAAEKLGDDAPTQDQLIQLLGQLHAADVLQCNVPPDTAELFRRGQKQQRKAWQSRLFSVFSWRFPLVDPERFLQVFLPLVRPMFSWGGALIWAAVVFPAVVLAGVYWTDLTENMFDQIMAPQNLFFLWMLFPILKLLHELGHGFAVKYFGGEVHEMGIMILVITPVPYVDASSSWGFRGKWQRILVSSAGMLVEVFLASLALYVWISVEPGLTRTIAYNAMLIAGVSTILFNINPLLRFDGYYIFSDYLEIPNLRTRANTFLTYVCERYFFGHQEATRPQTAEGEPGWFVFYSIAAFFYRIFIMTAIVFFLLDEYFLLGVILGTFGLVAWLGVPIGKGLKFLFTNARIRAVRGRAIAVTAMFVALIIGLLGFVPIPSRTMAEGVIWVPDDSYVRAKTEGFVKSVVVQSGQHVQKGDRLIICENLELSTEGAVLEGRLLELQARYRSQWPTDRVKASILEEELAYVKNELAEVRRRINDLIVLSPSDGTFVSPQAADLPGRFVKRGEQLAFVVDLEQIRVRAVVQQGDIDLVQEKTLQVDARFAEAMQDTMSATIQRIVPTATDDLPSLALGTEGGGAVPMNPMDGSGNKALQKLFLVDLSLPGEAGVVNVGGRVYLRFDHGYEPLVQQWARSLRQLFLSRFNV